MTSFRALRPRRDITCTSCGIATTVRREEDLCDECKLYQDRPNLAPG